MAPTRMPRPPLWSCLQERMQCLEMEWLGALTQMIALRSGFWRPWPSHRDAAGVYFMWQLHKKVRQCWIEDMYSLWIASWGCQTPWWGDTGALKSNLCAFSAWPGHAIQLSNIEASLIVYCVVHPGDLQTQGWSIAINLHNLMWRAASFLRHYW